jgi:hypothetical protein
MNKNVKNQKTIDEKKSLHVMMMKFSKTTIFTKSNRTNRT